MKKIAQKTPKTLKALGTKSGFTLVETLIYSVGLIIILGVIATLTYYMYDWYNYATTVPRVDRVGISTVDRMIREIREADGIDMSQSTLNDAHGALRLTRIVAASEFTKRFAYANGRITLEENGGAAKFLTPQNMDVSRFLISQITTPISEAIRVEIGVSYMTREGMKMRTYSSVATMRQSYD